MARLVPFNYIADIDAYRVGRFVVASSSGSGSSQISQPPPIIDWSEHATRDNGLLLNTNSPSTSISYNRAFISSLQTTENIRHHSFHGTDCQTASMLAANKAESQFLELIQKMRNSVDELETTVKRSFVPDVLKRSASDRYAGVFRDHNSTERERHLSLNFDPQNEHVTEEWLMEMHGIVASIQELEQGLRSHPVNDTIFGVKNFTTIGINGKIAKRPKLCPDNFVRGSQSQLDEASTLSVNTNADSENQLEKSGSKSIPETRVTTKSIAPADEKSALAQCFNENFPLKDKTSEHVPRADAQKKMETLQKELERYKTLVESQAKEIADLKANSARKELTATNDMKRIDERDLVQNLRKLSEQVSHYKTVSSIREKDLSTERHRLEELQERFIKKEVQWNHQQHELRSIICGLQSRLSNKEKKKILTSVYSTDYFYLSDNYKNVSYDDLNFTSLSNANESQKSKRSFFGIRNRSRKNGCSH